MAPECEETFVSYLIHACIFLYTRRQIDHRYVRGTGRICYRDVISDLTERFVLWYITVHDTIGLRGRNFFINIRRVYITWA